MRIEQRRVGSGGLAAGDRHEPEKENAPSNAGSERSGIASFDRVGGPITMIVWAESIAWGAAAIARAIMFACSGAAWLSLGISRPPVRLKTTTRAGPVASSRKSVDAASLRIHASPCGMAAVLSREGERH
jgi:hypothetical protein